MGAAADGLCCTAPTDNVVQRAAPGHR